MTTTTQTHNFVGTVTPEYLSITLDSATPVRPACDWCEHKPIARLIHRDSTGVVTWTDFACKTHIYSVGSDLPRGTAIGSGDWD